MLHGERLAAIPFSVGHFHKWITYLGLKISRFKDVKIIFGKINQRVQPQNNILFTQPHTGPNHFQVGPYSSPLSKSDPVQKKRNAVKL